MKKHYLAALFVFLSFILNAQQVTDSTKIFGITIADPWTTIPQLKDALSSHCIKPTARIVFDEWMEAKEYTCVVNEIATASFIMGELLDSYYIPDYSVKQYTDRTKEYLDEFENIVDIWEIGNEINGDWLGNTHEVVQKLEGAYTLVAARGKKTALTLYYNKSCFYNKPEYEMFTWANNNISEELRLGLDYVLVS